jgi:hypothetical protein
MYKTSSLFNKLGVICGEDMTTEAAITNNDGVFEIGEHRAVKIIIKDKS